MPDRPFGPARILAFSAIAEAATGLALMADPGLVASLLLGVNLAANGIAVGRVAGISLLALSVACWPGWPPAQAGPPALRAMLLYNALVALYLGYLCAVQQLGGVLFWPAVVLHAAVALVLAWTVIAERRAKAAA